MTMIDADTVLSVVDTVIEKRGADYVYPRWAGLVPDDHPADAFYVPDGCHYRWTSRDVRAGELMDLDLVEGQPACLAGAVFAEFGLLEMLVPDVGDDESENEAAIQSLEGIDDMFTPEAVLVLAVGQARQDMGDSWGQARDVMTGRRDNIRETHRSLVDAGLI